MKQIYTIGILVMLSLIVAGLRFHVNYEGLPEERALKQTPTKPKASLRSERTSRSVDLEPLWQRSLFAAYRGETESSSAEEKTPTASSSRTNMKLIGVCKFGPFAGATILDNTPVRSADNKLAKKAGTAFYRVGDTLASGYVLKSVTKKTAVLIRGGQELVLALDFGSEDSFKRNAQAVSEQKEHLEKEERRLADAPADESDDEVPEEVAALPLPPPAPQMSPSNDETAKSKRNALLDRLRKRTKELMEKREQNKNSVESNKSQSSGNSSVIRRRRIIR